MRRILLLSSFFVLACALAASAPTGAAADDDTDGVTLTVLDARVQPIKSKGKAWDADHGAIPFIVYHQLGGATGFPPLTLLSMVPYRNRPDPYVIVEAQGTELGKSDAIQGTFSPSWLLEIEPPIDDDAPPILTFRVLDDDLKDDDKIGQALVDLADVLGKPGLHRVEGSRGLYDISFVIRNPGAEGAGPEQTLHVKTIHVTVKRQRPAGGDWDAGGNPLAKRFPKIKMPKKLEGLPVVRPDLQLVARWSGGGVATSEATADVLETTWDPVGLRVKGRKGIGDGLYLTVTDQDLALSDPVGVIYVPFETFLENKEKGTIEIEGDELNGVEKATITFSLGS